MAAKSGQKTHRPEDMLLRIIRVAEILAKGEEGSDSKAIDGVRFRARSGSSLAIRAQKTQM
jgi:hypothetical protein